MTSPGGSEVGRVSVKAVPDTSRFSEQLRAELKKVKDDFTVDVNLNTSGVMAQYQALKRRIESRQISANLTVDQSAVDQVTSGFGRVSGAAGDLGSAFSSASRPGRDLTRILTNMAGISAVVVPLITTLSGGILAIGGAVSAGLAGLPVVLTSAIAPAGAVALGIEGIKSAAKTLKPEVDSLRSSLENTFERTMLPVFKRLSPLFPVLEDGLNGVAESLSEVANKMVDTLFQGGDFPVYRGVHRIGDALDGVSLTLDTMLPGLRRLFDELLNIAGMSNLYEILGQTISGVAKTFALFLENLQQDFLLTETLSKLRDLLRNVSLAVANMALAAMEFFAGAAPGLTDFFYDLSRAISNVDWRSLGESFGKAFRSLGKSLRDTDGQALEKFVQAISDLGKAVKDFVEEGGINVLISGLWGIIRVSTFVISVIAGIGNAVESAGDTISDFWDLIKTIFTTIGNFFRGFPANVTAHLGQFSLVVRKKTDEAMDSLATSVQDGVDDAASSIGSLPGRAMRAIGDLGSDLWSSGVSLMAGFIRGMYSMLPDLRETAYSIVRSVRSYFPFSPAEIGPFSGRGYTTYSGQSLVKDFAEGIEAASPQALREVDNLMASTQGKLSADFDSHLSSDSFGISGEVFNGVMAAFDGSRLQIDGDGVTSLVNKKNSKNKRR